MFEGTAEERSLLKNFFAILVRGKTLFERAMETATMGIKQNFYDENHKKTRAEAALAGAGAIQRTKRVARHAAAHPTMQEVRPARETPWLRLNALLRLQRLRVRRETP